MTNDGSRLPNHEEDDPEIGGTHTPEETNEWKKEEESEKK
jgi:hypothetical protein